MNDQSTWTFPDGLVIRPAELEDLPRIVAIDAELTGDEKQDFWQECHGRQTADPKTAFLVALQDGEVAGFTVGFIQAWEFGSPPCGWVQAMNVAAAHQGNHVATRLFEILVAQFRLAGITTVRTMLHIDNKTLMSFFRLQGMAAGPYIELEMRSD